MLRCTRLFAAWNLPAYLEIRAFGLLPGSSQKHSENQSQYSLTG